MPDVAIDSDSATINSVNLTEQGSDPATPASSHWRLYVKAGGLYLIDDTGAVVGPFGVGGGDLVNPMTDVGDLIVGGTDGAPERLAAALDGTYLSLSGGTPAWITPAFAGVVYNSAWASPPGAPSTGELWAPSDGHLLYIREGAAWVPICRIVRGTAPQAVASWTWVNQGGATAVDAGGTILLTTPSEASYAWRMLALAYPTVPFVVTAHFATQPVPTSTNNSAVAIGFRQDAAGGQQGYLHMGQYLLAAAAGNWAFYSSKFTSPTSATTNYTGAAVQGVSPGNLWLRMWDDNANRGFDISCDGVEWKTFHQITRLDYCTPDQVVFGASGGGIARAVRLLSWKVT